MERGVHEIADADASSVEREFRRQGWKVFVLPRGINDRESFFRAVRSTVPLDPPVLSDWNWDALSDSLWYGLHSLEETRVAILWPGSKKMAQSEPGEFDIARYILEDVAQTIGNPEFTAGEPKDLFVGLT
jgi:hypothetical protein